MANPDLSASRLLVSFQRVNKYEIMCIHLTDILLCICEYMYILLLCIYQKDSGRKKF